MECFFGECYGYDCYYHYDDSCYQCAIDISEGGLQGDEQEGYEAKGATCDIGHGGGYSGPYVSYELFGSHGNEDGPETGAEA